jgi:hypothetical protein
MEFKDGKRYIGRTCFVRDETDGPFLGCDESSDVKGFVGNIARELSGGDGPWATIETRAI